MNKIKVEVLCVGVTSWDLTFLVDCNPEPDEKMIAAAFHSCGGGPAANAAIAAAKLGLKVCFIGYLGNDIYGKMHFDELNAAGVNTDHIVFGNKQTPVSAVLLKPNGERALVNYRANHDYLKSSQSDTINPDFKVVLMDGHEPELSEHILKQRTANKFVSILDAGSLHQGTKRLFQKVDYLVASSKFAAEMTGSTNPEIAIEGLSKLNPQSVITLGSQGVIWKISDNTGKLPGLPVKAVDTTGAGDVFHGVFAACIALDWDWYSALKYANSAAALSCTKIGGRTSIPDKEQIDQIYQKYYQDLPQ